MRILVFFAATLIVHLAASAQGFTLYHFGKSALQMRDFLARQPPVCSVLPSGENENCVGLRMEQLQTQGDFSVEPPLDLRLGALDDPFHFKLLLHFFNADQELTRIDLVLDTDRYKTEGRN